MTGFELLLIGACCGAFNNNYAQEELAQRKLDTIKVREKKERVEQEKIEASYRPAKPPMFGPDCFSNAFKAAGIIILGFGLLAVSIEGIKCLVTFCK